MNLKDILANCAKAFVAGTEPIAWFFKRSDITPIYDNSNSLKVTNFTIADDAKGYKVYGIKKSINGTSNAVIAEDSSAKYTHSVMVTSSEIDAASRLVLKELACENLVFVIERKQKTGTGEGELVIFGLQSGVEASNFTTEMQVTPDKLVFSTVASNEEIAPCHIFHNTSLAVSKEILDNLMFACITDLDGNRYRYATIGTQTWLIDNWKCTKDRNGNSLTTKYPNNSAGNKTAYGLLYDWTDADLLSPTGWHLPDISEFATLATFAGGNANAGKKLKSVGEIYFDSPNTGTDDYGFNARGAGYVNGNTLTSVLFKSYTVFHSSDEYDVDDAKTYDIYNNSDEFREWVNAKVDFCSVRLIKD